ncbi:malate dehydrogenase (NAD) [Pontibacter ummariensis]|uniref:Malate dehydrogenase (NAD) n=1 Tax=Pontibacter ummariensis TaxID=1610492 RepID=A0A239B0X1_9BACT|nr:Ldh family oxidoreductase [Pontibacter ummariensis]PRY16229.1 malate dehydrogenase (NAD) [Pontibacter ummariensis]SNS01460.1 malate dehydrogenase (NAD) [Pontibacter ummariensis]
MYPYKQLFNFTQEVFLQMGCSPKDARLAAEVLLEADLRGVDSHGVARLSGYVRLWEAGRINPKPKMRIVHETPSTATVDGDAGLGLVIAPRAMDIAIEKAEKVGSGWVSVKNSNHFGIAGYHAMEALSSDMIGIAMTNASPLVAPTFSTDRMLGTNPIAVAVPTRKQPPFVADFATASAANGKLEILQRQEKKAPTGWIQTKDGQDTTNANELKEGGALLPLGSDKTHGSHKGYALASIVDIFSAVLSGANYGPWVPPFVSFLAPPADPVGQGIGHFLGAMRIDAFRPADEFKEHMDKWIETFRKAKVKKGEKCVLIPGDPEREMTAQRLEEGIPLLPPVERDLEQLGNKFGIKL